jgi:hypothetical protein
MRELVASLMDGTGLQPKTEPRPVVKQMRLQPPATRPVIETGSWQRRGAALGHAAERFLEHRGDPAGLVAGRGIVVHGLDPAAVPLPPPVPVEELVGHALIDGAPDEQVLGAIDLGCLRQHAGATVPDQLVDNLRLLSPVGCFEERGRFAGALRAIGGRGSTR